MLIEKLLLVTGSLIILGLGSLHLFYTFFSSMFLPRNPNVEIEMKNTSPRLTRQTTMWKAWIGFNASHSLGAIFFGMINLTMTLAYFPILQSSVVLSTLNCVTLLFYLFLARTYWFRIPFVGILVASVCFMSAFVLMVVN